MNHCYTCMMLKFGKNQPLLVFCEIIWDHLDDTCHPRTVQRGKLPDQFSCLEAAEGSDVVYMENN